MPYELRKSDGTVLLTLGDGLTDSASTSLTLIGKDVSNFGQIQNENFLYLLENFASTNSPQHPVRGQLWYDVTNLQLKFYNTTEWVPVAVNDYQSTQPSGAPGYFWYDTEYNQLYVNTGSGRYTLVGREGIKGYGTTRMSSEIIQDQNSHVNHPVIKIIANDKLIGVISTTTISWSNTEGFSGISKGITLKPGYILNGNVTSSQSAITATNVASGSAGSIVYNTGVGATSHLGLGTQGYVLIAGSTAPTWETWDNLSINHAANADQLTGGDIGSLVYQTDVGLTGYLPRGTYGYMLTQGADRPQWTNPTTFSVEQSSKATTATNIAGGVYGSIPYQSGTGTTVFLPLGTAGKLLVAGATSPQWIDGSTFSAGYATTASYATNANRLLNGDASSYITASTGTSAQSIVERDGNGNIWAHAFIGTATSARYADLAEMYLADRPYDPGTVVCIGGEKEVTACESGTRAIGVVSTNPAHLMNSGLEGGTPIALKGRVPCKVIGAVRKGDELISGAAGHAVVGQTRVFGVALETNLEIAPKVIEVLVL